MPDDARSQVSILLRQIADGEKGAIDNLCRVVYDDLRKVAGGFMRGERAGHTLQPTALVNEALIRLFDAKLFRGATNRAVFYGAAARAMRQVLVDHARQRNALKRAGQWKRTPLDDAVDAFEKEKLDLVELDRALEKLARLHSRQHDIVHFRFFGGISVAKIAEMLGVSKSTVEKELRKAHAFLYAELSDDRNFPQGPREF